MMKSESILQVDPSDNVMVALIDLEPGRILYQGEEFKVIENIPQKHKFLTTDLRQGERVIMYGVPVGTANEDLKTGSLITTQNITHFANPVEMAEGFEYEWEKPDVSKWATTTFNGYQRDDGRVGIANHWLFIPLVFCENRNLRVIEDALMKSLGYHKPNKYEKIVMERISGQQLDGAGSSSGRVFKNIDGIKFLYHQGGCGGTRQDSEVLLRLLAGYINNPNVAGATVLSLGCQNAQIDWFKKVQEDLYPGSSKKVLYFEQQKLLTEENLITQAIDQTINALEEVNKTERKPTPLSKLTVGLECGGSDGFSGISANPAVGYASDLVVSLGGSVILSEFPELNGVEQNIVQRCVNTQIAQKFINLQKSYYDSAKAVGSGFDMNPSPGNIKDGLITDAIKSAGAAKKGGTSPVTDVLDYTEPVTKPGLNLLCTPGNDVESTTGLAGSGANVILFTTGLGTPTGNPVAPVIKVSSNNKLSRQMNDIIDINAGPITTGEKSIKDIGEEILEEILAVAGGKETKAMMLDQNDFIPWKRGVSL